MEVNYFILSFIGIPFLGLMLSSVLPSKKEQAISYTAIVVTAIQLLSVTGFIAMWWMNGRKHSNIEEVVLYHSKEYTFLIDFFFDEVTATYLLIGSLITFLIVRYSQYYMHLESGYKRFFMTILFFNFGYNWTVLSGNFETLFMGWEILGVSSFLLIAFYRERYLPVRNAVKVFSIYRIGDIGVLAAMWATHHLWHENITFFKLENADLVHQHFLGHSDVGLFIGLALLVAAAAKSAQWPFSSWLPRAMEGPTPSSAIFYGSLSVHFGVFLLLRTYPLWQEQYVVRGAIALVGLLTAVVSYIVSQTQSSVKPQIAYASITQIGIMFVEVALGWHTFVLIHFAGNAFLRTYQLLISPSIVNYLIRDQLYHFVPAPVAVGSRWQNTLYVWSMKEGNLDKYMTNLFSRIKEGGRWLQFININNVLFFFSPLYIVGISLYFFSGLIPHFLIPYLPSFFALAGLFMVMRSFSEREHPRLAWTLVLFNHLSLALAVSFNENFEMIETIIFLSGIIGSGIVGLACLSFIRKKEPQASTMYEYRGLIIKYPLLAFVFFLSTLGLEAFPITPAFIGEDLLFSHIQQEQYGLAFIIAASFIISGIALIRIYARIFLGPYYEPSQSNPLKTS
jgi:NADH-quinone oxidoreductase subunit L